MNFILISLCDYVRNFHCRKFKLFFYFWRLEYLLELLRFTKDDNCNDIYE